jgi:F-type H+-transporting ATPase subunit alpha
LLNPENRVSEGAKVNGMSRVASILVGDVAIGSILDPVGNLILNSGRVDVQYRWVIESPAPGIIDRQSVFEPLQTGVLSLDSMVPIGRGQRELIVGDL